jgi:nucleotide-binding universal stress UspA family protein
MVSRVLVAMDDSEMAAEALRYALEVHADAAITVLTVVGAPSFMMGEATAIATATDPQEKAAEIAEPVVDRARELAAERDVEIETVIGYGHPAREIVNRASEFETVVLGSHGGSTADRLIVGDVAETVFNGSPVPVTVVR